MVIVKFKKGPLSWENYWFYEKPRLPDFFKCTIFMQCRFTDQIIGFKKEDFYTKIIDLSQDDDQILSRFRKNTRYEISRATKEGVEMHTEKDLDRFLDFYNIFAKSKNFKNLTKGYLESFRDNLVVTKATSSGEVLVMHAYIVDSSSKRARLLNSASLLNMVNDDEKASVIGRANRLLHFRDMLFFKDQGMLYYDFGGYAYNTRDEDYKRINEFKDCFGGRLALEPNFTPYPFLVLQTVKSLIFK